jgi:hypothetical protein
VPDGTLAAIDRLFDLVDHGVDHVERVLNRGRQTAERHRARKQRRVEAAAPAPSPRKSSSAPASSSTALTRKSRFYIVEAITPSGVTEFVVTDGGRARTACPSREIAEQILVALEKAP